MKAHRLGLEHCAPWSGRNPDENRSNDTALITADNALDIKQDTGAESAQEA